MKERFSEMIFREFDFNGNKTSYNVIKSSNTDLKGKCKITTDEESHNGIKIILKKDENDNVQEIKFVCSCGEAKTVQLNYTE